MKIEEYSFGRMKVNGKTYTDDVIVFPDRISAGWWRKEGHSLVPEDLEEVIAYHPDTLIIGTGHSGVMEVPESTVEKLKEEDIEVIFKPTREAVELFNRLSGPGKRVVGGFHLTC
jgi:hypothetical protein